MEPAPWFYGRTGLLPRAGIEADLRVARVMGSTWGAPIPSEAQHGPVAQRIERQASNLRAEVRLLPGPFRSSRPGAHRVVVPDTRVGDVTFAQTVASSVRP